ETIEGCDRPVQSRAILRRDDAYGRAFIDPRPQFGEHSAVLSRLVNGPGDQHPPSGERPFVEPAELLPELYHLSHHGYGRRLEASFPGFLGDIGEGADQDLLLRPGSPADQRHRGFRGAAMGNEVIRDLWEVLH